MDITPRFKNQEINTAVGEVGNLEVEPIDGLKDLQGTFKAKVADESILSIDEKGQWQALKEGETKVWLDYEWDEESLRILQEKYPDYKLVKRDILEEIPVKVVDKEICQEFIAPQYDFPTDVKFGETGQIKVAPIKGVSNITGTFSVTVLEDSVKDVISVDPTGRWEARNIGTMKFTLNFKISEESLKEIQEKSQGSLLAVAESVNQIVTVNVRSLGTLDITPTFTIASIEGKVGETGQIKVNPIEGITTSLGSFNINVGDPSIIEVDATGKWTALKAGSTSFIPIFSWSKETMAELEKKYPGYQFITKDITQEVPVTIDEVGATPTKPVGNQKPTGKQLPATNESSTNNIWMVGLGLLFVTTISWYKKQQSN